MSVAAVDTAAGMPAAFLRSMRETAPASDRIEEFIWRIDESVFDTHSHVSHTEPLLAAVGPLSATPVAADGLAGGHLVLHYRCAGGHAAGGKPLH